MRCKLCQEIPIGLVITPLPAATPISYTTYHHCYYPPAVLRYCNSGSLLHFIISSPTQPGFYFHAVYSTTCPSHFCSILLPIGCLRHHSPMPFSSSSVLPPFWGCFVGRRNLPNLPGSTTHLPVLPGTRFTLPSITLPAYTAYTAVYRRGIERLPNTCLCVL